MRIAAELEQKQWECERHHEERIHGMFKNRFQLMMMMECGWATAPFSPMPVPYPAPTEDPSTLWK